MIIVKEYKSLNHRGGNKELISLAFYERKSFRVEGKVKKKDIYLMTLKINEIDNILNSDLDGMKELQKIKDAIIKYNNKQAKKLEEKFEKEKEFNGFLKKEGFIDKYQYEKYLASVEGGIFKNKEEFFRTKLSLPTTIVPLEVLRYGFKAGMDLDYWISKKDILLTHHKINN